MRLPQELYDLIIAYCEEASLPNLVLASALFHYAARSRMYRHVHVHRGRTPPGLSALHLAPFVHHLEVGRLQPISTLTMAPEAQSTLLMHPANRECPSGLDALLSNASSLRDLRIHVPLDFDVLQAALQLVGPRLEKLHVVLGPKTWFDVRQRPKGLPNLRALCIVAQRPTQYSPLAIAYFASLAPNLATVSFPSGLSDIALTHLYKVVPTVRRVCVGEVVVQSPRYADAGSTVSSHALRDHVRHCLGQLHSDAYMCFRLKYIQNVFSPKMRAPFPLELQYEVVAYADRPTLCTLIRTHSTLAREAMPLFYQRLTVTTSSALVRLRVFLHSHPDARVWIDHLTLIHAPVSDMPTLPRLRSLHWTIMRSRDDPHSLRNLPNTLAHFPSLISLAMHGGLFNAQELDVALTPVRSRLRALDLSFAPPSFRVGNAPTPSQGFPLLRRLTFADGSWCDLLALVQMYFLPAQAQMEVMRLPRFCSWRVYHALAACYGSTLQELYIEPFVNAKQYTCLDPASMPALHTLHFEVHRSADETRSEWTFMEDFMGLVRRQKRSFPALRTVAVRVFAATSDQMSLCGDWECALFRLDEGPSQMEWRKWMSSVLLPAISLHLTVFSPLPSTDRTLRAAIHRRLADVHERLSLHIVPR